MEACLSASNVEVPKMQCQLCLEVLGSPDGESSGPSFELFEIDGFDLVALSSKAARSDGVLVRFSLVALEAKGQSLLS